MPAWQILQGLQISIQVDSIETGICHLFLAE